MRNTRYEGVEIGQRRPVKREFPLVEAERGLVVEDAEGRFCGAVAGYEKGAVILEDRHGKRRQFPLTPGAFLLEGQPVTLVHPTPQNGPVKPGRTASGSIKATDTRAKVARASRIYVEGRHDAELVEKIWGDDLRDVGVVVEYLEGIDDLPAIVHAFSPGPDTPARRPRRPPGGRLEGIQDRRPGQLPRRADRRAPVYRHLGGGPAIRRRHPELARRPARPAVEGRRAARHRLAAGDRRGLAAHSPLRHVVR